MNNVAKSILWGVTLSTLVIVGGCKKDDDPGQSIEDIQLEKLSQTWTASSVTLDATTQTGYDNFTLTISGTAGNTSFGYTAAGRPPTSPWPSSGTWSFGGVPETQIVRDPNTGDQLDLTYSVSVDDAGPDQLQITFAFSGTGYPGKVSNVNGQWVFTLTAP